MDRQQLSAILKEHRVNNGVLLKRICAQMDTGESSIYRIENGVYNFNCNMWLSYMNAIGVVAKLSGNGNSIYLNTVDEMVEAVRNIRKENNITQRELAQIIGISHVNIANVERGHTSLTIDFLLSVAKAFRYELQIIDKIRLNDNKQ